MSELSQDQKTYRKLHKCLRQIEKLNLLERPLNEEEKAKIAKRSNYREKLKNLQNKYPNGELLSIESVNNTFEAEDASVISQNVSIEKQDQKEEINELSNKLNQMSIKQEEQIQVDRTEPKVEQAASVIKESFKIEVKKKEKPVVLKKENITFDSISFTNAHQDLIVCIDVDAKNNLVVTGSRDTSIKLWKFNDKKCELIKTFGEHSNVITRVKFWDVDEYRKSIKCLKNDLEENEILIDSLPEVHNDLPLVLSCSLDCSIRLWSENGCLKELYMYNPIKSFDFFESFFIIGQDAGKVQLWKDFKKIQELKTYEEIENVVCVKFLDNHLIYAITQNGSFKIFSYDDKSLKEIENIQFFEIIKENFGQMEQNFKCFEILESKRIVLLNGDQSFLILIDIEKCKCDLLSTNSNLYAFSSCFHYNSKTGLLFVSSYNVDDGQLSINVFDNSNNLSYKCSIQDDVFDDNHYSISAISSSSITSKENKLCLATGSGSDIKIYFIDFSNRSSFQSKKVKYIKMVKQIDLNNKSIIDSNDESDDEENYQEKSEKESETKTQNNKSSCLIQ